MDSENLFSRIGSILACPSCGKNLSGPDFQCGNCGSKLAVAGKQFFAGVAFGDTMRHNWLNACKERAKRCLGSFYPLAIRVLAPVHFDDATAKHFLATFNTQKELVADLGSGTTHYAEQVICVDGASYPNVHMVCDLASVPFQDASLDGILSMAVLEHVLNPAAHVREMMRLLKPGGRAFCYIPFIQGYHASPDDYQRFTISGLRQLFSGFEILKVRVFAGPTSGLLWILQEWLALVLSLGIRPLYRCILPLTWILSPLKYLDLALSRHPEAHVIASGLCIEVKKIEDGNRNKI